MFLGKLFSGIAFLALAGVIQSSMANPLKTDGKSMIKIAEPPKVFYYDPAHLSAIKGLVTPKEGECNMLLSVKKKGDEVSGRAEHRFADFREWSASWRFSATRD